jgi:uncharacterized membrane protein YbhN (UPF0104 family)
MRPGLGAALRFAVGFAALGLLIARMDPARAWAVVASADPAWLVAALAAQLAGKAFWVLRWGTLLASTGHRRRAGELLRWILVGLFFNNFLPTSVGGDVARGLGIAQGGVPRATAAASVVGDRLIGLFALGILAVLGGALGAAFWPGQGPWGGAAIVALAVVTILVVLTRPAVLDRVGRSTILPDRWGLRGRLQRVLLGVSFLGARGRTVARAVALSVGLAACAATYHWAIGRAVGIPVGLAAYCVIVPAVMLFAALPITMNGLGIRELGFVGLLAAQGVPVESAAVFALLAFLGTLAFAMVGGVIFLAGGGSSPRRAEGETA